MSVKDWIISADLDAPHVLAPTLLREGARPRAYGLQPLTLSPSTSGSWVGSRAQGASVNCDDAQLSIHAAGTHTECVAHVSDLPVTIAEVAPLTLLRAMLVTLIPEQTAKGDRVISAQALETALSALEGRTIDALIVRTLPQDQDALRDWSGTNPPFFAREAMIALAQREILHLITDLPSVDQEVDGGLLVGHRAFFGLWPKGAPERPYRATITELAVIPPELDDGFGVLRLDVMAWPSDAAPSRPIFYPLAPYEST